VNLRILHIGKNISGIESLEKEYLKRISHYARIESVAVKQAKGLPPEKTIVEDGKSLLERTSDDKYRIVLDEKGKNLTSHQFAEFLNRLQLEARTIDFLIAGAYGHSMETRKNANYRLSLSKMTFQHDIAYIVLLEQIYRALSIIHGQNYHK